MSSWIDIAGVATYVLRMDEFEPPKLSRFERIFGKSQPVKVDFAWFVMVIAMGLVAYFARASIEPPKAPASLMQQSQPLSPLE
jgi:hypothetical protein